MSLQSILGAALIIVTVWELALCNPFHPARGWDRETTPYFIKWIIIGWSGIIIFITCLGM